MAETDGSLTTNCGDCGAEPGEFCQENCSTGTAGGYRKSDRRAS